MMSFSFTGKVFSVTTTDREGPDGKPSSMATMKFTTSQRVKDKSGQWVYDNYWCEAIAFGSVAERWAKFSKGDIIEGSGRLEIDTYPKNDGTIGMTLKVRGFDGLTPSISWVPRDTRSEGDAVSVGRITAPSMSNAASDLEF